MSFEALYITLVNKVISNGEVRKTRAGPARSLFSTALTIPDLLGGYFPLLTTRQLYPRPVLGELAAFLNGCEDLASFKAHGCNYWDGNAKAWPPNEGKELLDMRIGKIYGAKWRNFHGKDQLTDLTRGLLQDPMGRRHILTTWDPSEEDACLPPCHILAQFYVHAEVKRLSLNVYMRSVDLCLGLPSDVVLYSALLCLVAREVGLYPGVITFMFGDAHVYENHVTTWVHKQSDNLIRPPAKYKLTERSSVFDFHPDDFIFDYGSNFPKVNYELNV